MLLYEAFHGTLRREFTDAQSNACVHEVATGAKDKAELQRILARVWGLFGPARRVAEPSGQGTAGLGGKSGFIWEVLVWEFLCGGWCFGFLAVIFFMFKRAFCAKDQVLHTQQPRQ